uniref:Uncharacterized protein n=1 Tax=Neobodo designis TaxID=312471 RepID=A0A7S1W7G6_NEODS
MAQDGGPASATVAAGAAVAARAVRAMGERWLARRQCPPVPPELNTLVDETVHQLAELRELAAPAETRGPRAETTDGEAGTLICGRSEGPAMESDRAHLSWQLRRALLFHRHSRKVAFTRSNPQELCDILCGAALVQGAVDAMPRGDNERIDATVDGADAWVAEVAQNLDARPAFVAVRTVVTVSRQRRLSESANAKTEADDAADTRQIGRTARDLKGLSDAAARQARFDAMSTFERMRFVKGLCVWCGHRWTPEHRATAADGECPVYYPHPMTREPSYQAYKYAMYVKLGWAQPQPASALKPRPVQPPASTHRYPPASSHNKIRRR